MEKQTVARSGFSLVWRRRNQLLAGYYNSVIHERNSKIGDHYTNAKFEYLAKARSCQILPGGGSESNFGLRSIATQGGSVNTRNVPTE